MTLDLPDLSDDAFVATLRERYDRNALQTFADVWKRDRGELSRRRMVEYLAQPLDRPEHHTVVKQLIKQAEDEADHEVMAAALVACDRLVRYERRRTTRWDSRSQAFESIEHLKLPQRYTPWTWSGDRPSENPYRRESEGRQLGRARLFTHRTRFYLRRRTWRYFRRLGFSQPSAYVEAIAPALLAYRDEDLATGEAILESWGLMHACYGQSEAITKTTVHIRLRSGCTMADLQPAPYHAALWQTDAAAETLLRLVRDASSSLVRGWAWAMLTTHHDGWLATLAPANLVALFETDDAIAAEAIERFRQSPRLGELSLDDWLVLLHTPNPLALDAICEAMARHVFGDDVTTAQCVELLVRPPTPIARLGLAWLDERPFDPVADRDLLRRAASAESVALGGEIADWVLAQAGTSRHYDREVCCDLFDSTNPAIRREAWNWLTEDDLPGQSDPALWTRIVETPHDDLRLPLIDLLARSSGRGGAAGPSTGLGVDELAPLWMTVLAGVLRGSRQKPKAIAQLRDAIARHPDRADELLPILRLAVRSVRGPEQAAALAAVVSLAETQPALEPAIAACIPELELSR